VGVKVGVVLWALEWTWHFAETNLLCAGISGICVPNPSIVHCMPNPSIVALIVSEISAFKDGQTDGQTTLPSACYIHCDESRFLYSTSNGYKLYSTSNGYKYHVDIEYN